MRPYLHAQAQTNDLLAQGSEALNTVIAFIAQKGADFGINLLSAVLIFFVGRWVAKLLKSISSKLMIRAKLDETLVKFLANLAYSLLLAFVIIAAIDSLGVNTTSFAALLAAAGLAVGLALQSSLSNFASGVMLIMFQPFKVGDFVDAAGSAGVIEEVHIFRTLMRTGDNVQITIPNSAITAGTITNFSAKDTRRIDLSVGCGYADDLKAVKSFLTELVSTDERILDDPEPVVAVHELGDSSVNFVVRPWVNSEDYWAVRWDLTENIKVGFDANGFSIPYPTQELHLHGMSERDS